MYSNPWVTPYRDKVPSVHPDAFVDVSARIIGQVQVDQGASIWPMAVLRADTEMIRVGHGAAILDHALIEAPEGHPVWIGDEALVSHGAMVHGAQIQSKSLVGIGSIILDGALVSTGSIIGAGSVVPPGTEIPPDSLVLGVPGKIVRATTPEERASIMDQIQELREKSRFMRAQ